MILDLIFFYLQKNKWILLRKLFHFVIVIFPTDMSKAAYNRNKEKGTTPMLLRINFSESSHLMRGLQAKPCDSTPSTNSRTLSCHPDTVAVEIDRLHPAHHLRGVRPHW